MDFSTAFVALRDGILSDTDPAFSSRQNVEIAGRMAAVLCTANLTSERKLLGLMPLGGVSHAHEYRLLFAAPALDEAALTDWWQYALQAERALVRPDANHDFSFVSMILAADTVEKPALRALKKLDGGRQFSGGAGGWSSVRMAVVELPSRRVYTNRMGDAMKNILNPIVRKALEKGSAL